MSRHVHVWNSEIPPRGQDSRFRTRHTSWIVAPRWKFSIPYENIMIDSIYPTNSASISGMSSAEKRNALCRDQNGILEKPQLKLNNTIWCLFCPPL